MKINIFEVDVTEILVEHVHVDTSGRVVNHIANTKDTF